MIRWTFPCTRFLVHIARSATLGHCRAGQYQVNTQTCIAAKSGGTIIPPAEHVFRLLEFPKNVAETEFKDGIERITFLRAAQNRIAPLFRIVDIRVGRGDIEVAQHHDIFMLLQLGF